MALLKVKGHEFEAFTIRSSFNRSAVQSKNHIIRTLKRIGIQGGQVEIPLEPFALKRAPAFVEWYMDGQYLYFGYDRSSFAENIKIISHVLQLEVEALLAGNISNDDFIRKFAEDDDFAEQRIKARETLGVHPDTKDMDIISKRYKELAKLHHPDKDTGNTEKFKEINHAHKVLQRELQ